MAGCESAPIVSRVERVPRRSEYLLRLSDGSDLRILKEHLSQFGIEEGRRISQQTILEVRFAYDYAKARQHTLRLLKTRPRTEGELRKDFARRSIPAVISDRLIDDLKHEGLIDDRLFAELWIKEKIGRGTSGKKRILSDLQAKGINRAILEEELAEKYSDAKEVEIARGLASKRLARLEDLPAGVRRRRVYNYLLGRGFGSDVAAEATGFALESLSMEGSS